MMLQQRTPPSFLPIFFQVCTVCCMLEHIYSRQLPHHPPPPCSPPSLTTLLLLHLPHRLPSSLSAYQRSYSLSSTEVVSNLKGRAICPPLVIGWEGGGEGKVGGRGGECSHRTEWMYSNVDGEEALRNVLKWHVNTLEWHHPQSCHIRAERIDLKKTTNHDPCFHLTKLFLCPNFTEVFLYHKTYYFCVMVLK